MLHWLKRWLKRRGARPTGTSDEWLLDCPFPECGKANHLYVNVRTGRWICHRCGNSGRDPKKLLFKVEGPTWMTDPRMRLSMMEDEEQEQHDTDRSGEVINVSLPSEFIPAWNGENWSFPKYLTARRITRETAKRLNLGYCVKGDFANRIILPIDCPIGRSFTSRLINNHGLRYKAGEHAGRLLFGWQSLDWFAGDVILVEGPFDAMRVIQAGYSSVALMGKNLSQTKLSALNTISRGLITMLDEGATMESVKIARALGTKISCAHGDPDEMKESDLVRSVKTSMNIEEFWIKHLIKSDFGADRGQILEG